MSAEETVLGFVDAINRADLVRLASLMTENHVFVDSDGSTVAARGPVIDAWTRFFAMVPRYAVDVRERFSAGSTVVLVGIAEGGPAGPGRWSVPAAWRAVVEGGQVAVWQVFVNPEPILAALGGRPVGDP